MLMTVVLIHLLKLFFFPFITSLKPRSQVRYDYSTSSRECDKS